MALAVKCHGGKPANAKGARDAALISGSGRSPRVGNGNPLQYSCLENSMGTGIWWTTVHGVAESQTQLTTKLNAKQKQKQKPHNTLPYASKGFPLYSFCCDILRYYYSPFPYNLMYHSSALYFNELWSTPVLCRVIKLGQSTIFLYFILFLLFLIYA